MLLSALGSFIGPNNATETLSAFGNESFIAMAFIVAVTPAFCEELIFRGYILEKSEGLGMKKAVLVNGLFFAFMHLDLQQFLYTFFMGAVFALFVLHARSLTASIFAHFCINATQLALSRLMDIFLRPADSVLTNQELLSSFITLTVAALIFLPAVIIFYRAFVSHNRKRNTRGEILSAMRADASEQEMETEKPGKVSVFAPEFFAVAGVYIAWTAINFFNI
jgi:membrane protease YdiL (CAAX protease family)